MAGTDTSAKARVRIVIGAWLVVGLILGVVVVTSHGPGTIAVSSVAAPRDAGRLLAAPEPPHLGPLGAQGVRLTGVVVDGAGLPVAGAQVSAEIEKGVADKALAPSSGSGSSASASGAAAVAQLTGADGRFLLEGLAAGRYRLRVKGEGLLPAEVRFVPVPSDETRVVIARQIAIDGTVTDGGRPVAGATVGIRGDAIGGALEIKTDNAGAFHAPNLPEGRYQVYAWQSSLAARAMRVARLGAGPFGPVELHLEAATIVVGRVIDRDEGTGLAAAIELRPSGDDQAPRYARSGQDGAFKIEGVPTGKWIADGFAPGYTSAGGVELEAGHGVAELQLARGGAIEGRVVDADGRPIAGANVRALGGGESAPEVSADVDRDRLRRFSGRSAAPVAPDAAPGSDPMLIARGELGVMVGPIPPLPAPGVQATLPATIDPSAGAVGLLGDPPPLPDDPHGSIWVTGTDGHYRIRGVPNAKLTVLAQAAGFAEARSKQVAVGTGEVVTGVDIVMSAGVFVVGKVTDQHGAPVTGAELSAQPDVGAPAVAFSDADGEYRLGPVAGAVELRASAYGHVEVRRAIDLVAPHGSLAGEHREDLVLAVADAVLAGSVDDTTGVPVGAAHIEVLAGSSEGRNAITAADGTFSIDMLPAGHVRVRIEHPSYPPVELDAVATTGTGERVRLVLPLGGGAEGVLLDAVSGAPVSSVTLTASGPSGQNSEASSDKDGRWKLGPLRAGAWKLSIALPGYLATSRSIDVPAADTPGATTVRDIRIDLQRGALVGGTVRDARGQRAVGAHVTVRATDGSGVAVEADVDGLGEFRIHDCPTGELSVLAARGDEGGSVHATVRPGDEVLGLTIEIR